MNCNCIAEIDKELAEKNMALDTKLTPSGEVTLAIPTRWKDPAKKVRGQRLGVVTVDCCPFCGEPTEKVEELKK